MTSGIGGGGGIGGPRGPSGPGGPGGPGSVGGVGGAAGTSDVDGAGEALSTGSASGARGVDPAAVDRLAADLQAGRISADEALAQLISEAVPGGLADLDRAELRAALGDLLATDPYLASLAARLGATASEG